MRDEILKLMDRTVSPNDNMFGTAGESAYFGAACSALECIEQAMEMAEVGQVNRILDFPCGYGRILRALAARFPQAEICACDIVKEGVDFCVNNFQAEGIYSRENVREIQLNKSFDLIWCGSLLTHVPEDKARQFLDFFIDHLNKGGLLLASFHGRLVPALQYNTVTRYTDFDSFKKIEAQCYKTGFGFSEYEGMTDYGVSLTSLDWTMKYVMGRPDTTLIYYSEKRFDGHQDILALKKTPVEEHYTAKIDIQNPLQDFCIPDERAEARFYIDYVDKIDDTVFTAFGWAFLKQCASAPTTIYLLLKSKNHQYAFATNQLERVDVGKKFGDMKYGMSGFQVFFNTGRVNDGIYRIGLLLAGAARSRTVYSHSKIEIAGNSHRLLLHKSLRNAKFFLHGK